MPWLRWDRSCSRKALSHKRRLGPGPSLGDGAGLTMAWDECLGMERQSSDKMVAQDGGMAAIALVSLPPAALRQSHANVPRNGGTRRMNWSASPSPEGLPLRPSRAQEPRRIPTCDAATGSAPMR